MAESKTSYIDNHFFKEDMDEESHMYDDIGLGLYGNEGNDNGSS